jgi:hypothetical protein
MVSERAFFHLPTFNPNSERHFARAEWQKIVAAKGDFSVLGIKLKHGPPVPDF